MTTTAIPPLTEWKRWVPERPVVIAWGVLIGVLGWTYWATMNHLVYDWWSTDEYIHGFLVPPFAAFLLWLRQDMVNPWPRRGSWWGIAFLAVWALTRWAILYLNYERDADSLFPFLIGLTLFVGGWQALRWAWPSIAFLLFMMPLPGAWAVALSRQLQRFSTVSSAYVLQTLGIPAIVPGDQGTVIQLSDPGNSLDVEQACSGLKMLMLFFAICVGAALVRRASWWEKTIMVVSAVPIALLSNVGRITITGLLSEWVNPKTGHFFHEYLAAFFMMPLALALLWGEMTLLDKLLPEVRTEGPLVIGDLEARAPDTRENLRTG